MLRIKQRNLRKLVRLWQFSGFVFKHFVQNDYFYRASALTFTTLLALVPLSFVMLTIFSIFPISTKFASDIQNFIFENFVPSTGEALKVYLIEFVNKAAHLSWLGIIFLTITAVLMLFTVEQAFNRIWHVKRRRRSISTFMLYWSILTLSPLLLGASFALSTYLISLPEVTSAADWLGVTEMLLSLIVFLLVWLVFAIIYITIPNCQVPVFNGFLGGFVSAVLYELMRKGFILYISYFSSYQLIYGALAVIPVFLIWLYLLWQIILFGAVLTRCMTFRYTIIGQRKLSPFIHAIQWLGYLWQAQQQGKSLSLLDMVRRDRCQYEVSPEEQIEKLQQAGLVMCSKAGHYLLQVDIYHFTLLDLYHRLPWKLPTVDDDYRKHFWVNEFNEYLVDLDHDLGALLKVKLPELIRVNR